MPERYLGQQIGKYWVTRLLGGGAFAWVYEAVDRDLEIPVALKILRPEFAGQPDAEARFRREAATAARLRHPNIVTVRDVGQVGSASFVAMDLMPLSLARRLEVLPRLPEADVVRIGLGVAAALVAAHAGGIVHRDIKPDNILISSAGDAVVADFGLARALDSGNDPARSGANQVMGTPHYFSPEQARGLEVDGRSDLYALGVTLYRAVTGRVPFEGDDWYAVARMHVEATVPSARLVVPEISEAFDAVLRRLMQKSPADRYGSALEVADALATLDTAPAPRNLVATNGGADETITAYPPVKPAEPPRRRPWLGIGLVTALLIGVSWIGLQSPGVRDSIASWAKTPSSLFTRSPVPAPTDSLPRVPTDTPAVAAIVDTTPAIPAVTAPPADTTRRAAVAVAKTRLVITAGDSAQLYVNSVPVGRGTAIIERNGVQRFAVKAVIASAPPECAAASRDSVVRLAAGEQATLSLAVRTCVGVRFTVVPEDALVRFESLDGGTSVDVRADSSKAVLLPVGRYEVKATAQGCFPYGNDILVVTRDSDEKARSRAIRLKCD